MTNDEVFEILPEFTGDFAEAKAAIDRVFNRMKLYPIKGPVSLDHVEKAYRAALLNLAALQSYQNALDAVNSHPKPRMPIWLVS